MARRTEESDELLASRKAASAETLKSANARAAKRHLAAAKRDLAAATERAAASDAAAAKSAETLDPAEGAAAKAHFEKELLAKRLAEPQTQADARAEKTSGWRVS